MERYVEGRERVWMKTNCMESEIPLLKFLNTTELCKNTCQRHLPKTKTLDAEFHARTPLPVLEVFDSIHGLLHVAYMRRGYMISSPTPEP
jgi:hypothetical protein